MGRRDGEDDRRRRRRRLQSRSLSLARGGGGSSGSAWREAPVEAEVRPVGLVDDQGNLLSSQTARGGEGKDVGAGPEVGRRDDEHRGRHARRSLLLPPSSLPFFLNFFLFPPPPSLARGAGDIELLRKL